MSESKDSDFVDNIKRQDAADAARRRAIDPPSWPPDQRRRTNSGSEGGWAATALRNETETVRTASKGTRNGLLNTAGFNLGQIVAAGALDFDVVARELTAAALACGLTRRELKAWKLPERAIRKGMEDPRDMSDKGSRANTTRGEPRKDTTQQGKSEDWDEEPRRITVRSLNTVKTRVPMWVWEYEKVGRIQLGTLCMFVGKPSAGKSTATRWFGAQLSNGTLPGVWEGYPMNIGVYSPEEQLDDTIAPSFQAHGADLNRVMTLGVSEDGFVDGLLSVRDENRLIEELKYNDIRALFVDPVISTFDGKLVDANKTTDVRRHLMPYVRVAQEINGIVVCVTHLRKGTISDVMTNINGSSAFGELPRSIFGFASVGDGSNVMEQVKNSAGPTGLKLEYRLPIERGEADDGQFYELPRFEIKGETELSIIDLGSERDDEDAITSSADVVWLQNYLQIEQPAPSKRVKDDALKNADISNSRLHKARKKLRVQIISTPKPDAPHTTAWCLPGFLVKKDS